MAGAQVTAPLGPAQLHRDLGARDSWAFQLVCKVGVILLPQVLKSDPVTS